MKIFLQFNFNIDKKRIFNTVTSYCTIPSLEEYNRMFEDMLNELYDLASPVGIYLLEQKPKEYAYEILKNCSHIFFCVITIGDKVTKRVDELFGDGEYINAVLLDVMASTLLFEYTRQLHDKIFEEAKQLDMGLTCRVSPGDGEIPLEYQSDILSRIGNTKRYGIYSTNRYLLKPDKSMTFVYGSDKEIIPTVKDHDCLECSNINCKMREV